MASNFERIRNTILLFIHQNTSPDEIDTWFSGEVIQKGTQYTPVEINDAIEILRTLGYVFTAGALGTAPFKFARVKITAIGKDYVYTSIEIQNKRDVENTIENKIQDSSYEEIPAEFFVQQSTIKYEKGLLTKITSDLWTIEDALGYDNYAYAIYKFIISKDTSPPLTISIQAPWGGGKTSLLKMIQKYLDPQKVESEIKGIVNLNTESGKVESTTLKTRDILNELKLNKKGLSTITLKKETLEDDKRLTIWFNAWKYQKTEQVWAGLADAIIRQIIERLEPVEREKFFLHLHLLRIDATKIRESIYNQISNLLISTIFPWILAFLIAIPVSMGVFSYGTLLNDYWVKYLGLIPLVSTAFLVIAQGINHYSKIMNSKAEFSLNEYIKMPNYSETVGFIHQIDEDLKYVFHVLKEMPSPIVIFIDDLDRCLPDKVAEVVEAINLFLSGNFRKCIFILGMDTEIVAASLDAAHKQVLEQLTPDTSRAPIGWKFMDKFVQLPFYIPPPEENDIENFLKTILSKDKQKIGDNANQNIIDTEYKEIQSKISVSKKIMDKGISDFTDEDSVLRQYVLTMGVNKFQNPRELKRFINLFRFLYFLSWARKEQNLNTPTVEQILRWVEFGVKFPEAARWVRYTQKLTVENPPISMDYPQNSRLRQIESIAATTETHSQWLKELQEEFNDEKLPSWLIDKDLWAFIWRETQLDLSQRLSSAEGLGLW